jgi:hypothetical protein
VLGYPPELQRQWLVEWQEQLKQQAQQAAQLQAQQQQAQQAAQLQAQQQAQAQAQPPPTPPVQNHAALLMVLPPDLQRVFLALPQEQRDQALVQWQAQGTDEQRQQLVAQWRAQLQPAQPPPAPGPVQPAQPVQAPQPLDRAAQLLAFLKGLTPEQQVAWLKLPDAQQNQVLALAPELQKQWLVEWQAQLQAQQVQAQPAQPAKPAPAPNAAPGQAQMGERLMQQAIASIPPGSLPQFGANAGNPQASYPPPGSGPGSNPAGGYAQSPTPGAYVPGRTGVSAPTPTAAQRPQNPQGFIKAFLDGQAVTTIQIYTLAAAIAAIPPEQSEKRLLDRVCRTLGRYVVAEDVMEQALVNLAPALQISPLVLLQEVARAAMGGWDLPTRPPHLMLYIHLAVKYAYLSGSSDDARESGLTRVLIALKMLSEKDSKDQREWRLRLLQIIRDHYVKWPEEELRELWRQYELKYFPASENP